MLELTWTHWIVIGIVLITLESFTMSFYLFFFGLSSLIVGGIDYFFNLNYKSEISLLLLFTTIFLLVWFFYLKKKDKIDRIGQSEQELNKKGKVIKKIEDMEDRYEILFEDSILGSRTWISSSKDNIKLEIDDIVELLEIKAQLAKVQKINK